MTRKHVVVDAPHLDFKIATSPLRDDTDEGDSQAYGVGMFLATTLGIDYKYIYGVPEDEDPFEHEPPGGDA